MSFSSLCSPIAVDRSVTAVHGKLHFCSLHVVCSKWNKRGIGDAANNGGLCQENPDKRAQVHWISGLEGGLKPNFYRAEWPGSLSSVSGVNRPICMAKRITSLRVRSPSFSVRRERYVSTVFTLTVICLAICALV